MPLTSRVQVLFEPAQLLRLRTLAEAEGKSVGALVREAVERAYLDDERRDRMAAVERLVAMSLPVAEWEQMERESTDRYEDG